MYTLAYCLQRYTFQTMMRTHTYITKEIRMKIPYILLMITMLPVVYAADPLVQKNISITLLTDKPELIAACSQLWYENLGCKHYPNYEIIKDKHTDFIKSHAYDDVLPIMFLALFDGEVIGTCALRKTAYPRMGVAPWADEHPEATPWLSGAVVAERFQEQGIGTKLALAILEYAKTTLHINTMYCLPGNEELAQKYMQKGCTKIGETMLDGKQCMPILTINVAHMLQRMQINEDTPSNN